MDVLDSTADDYLSLRVLGEAQNGDAWRSTSLSARVLLNAGAWEGDRLRVRFHLDAAGKTERFGSAHYLATTLNSTNGVEAEVAESQLVVVGVDLTITRAHEITGTIEFYPNGDAPTDPFDPQLIETAAIEGTIEATSCTAYTVSATQGDGAQALMPSEQDRLCEERFGK